MRQMLTALIIALLTVLPARAAAPKTSMRGVWVSSVYNIDYPQTPSADAASLGAQADEVLSGAKELGMNAVFLQVRPAADALYPSAYYPWSRYLTGTQGIAPSDGFDPLAYWIDGAHARGMELHAWLNPFRVANSSAEFDAIAANHPARLHPDWVVEAEGRYYFNPGIPEVTDYIIAGVEEIVTAYPVDGIHLDDYFYPGTVFDDAAAYAQHGGGVPLDDWRRGNVDRLISGLHALCERSGVTFGVSPAGIWTNRQSHPDGSDTGGRQTFYDAYADSRGWVQNGWVDYICPQLYWYIGHPTADYDTLAHWWADTVRGTDTTLYIGIADYQAGNADPSSPWHRTAAIEQALALNRTIPEIDGEIHFSYHSIAENPELTAFYQARHTPPSLRFLPALMRWLAGITS